MAHSDNKRDVFAHPTGPTGSVPLGKSELHWSDFGAGVSTTKETRHRAGGGSNANPSARSIVAYEDAKLSFETEGDDSTDIGGGQKDSDDHRDGQGIDRR